jgi:hypothetical protein
MALISSLIVNTFTRGQVTCFESLDFITDNFGKITFPGLDANQSAKIHDVTFVWIPVQAEGCGCHLPTSLEAQAGSVAPISSLTRTKP